jgi:hypothetical protein
MNINDELGKSVAWKRLFWLSIVILIYWTPKLNHRAGELPLSYCLFLLWTFSCAYLYHLINSLENMDDEDDGTY